MKNLDMLSVPNLIIRGEREMKRSDKIFPLPEDNFCYAFLKKMWKEGWLDEFSNEHFLIRAIEHRLDKFLGINQIQRDNSTVYPYITIENFECNFLINFSVKIGGISNLFGENQIKRFVKDQISAGKKHYSEEQFFRALSEISIIAYFCTITEWKEKIYEPKLNGKKNPEIRLISNDNTIIDIEVKTPGFNQANIVERKMMPTVLLTDEGRIKLQEHCEKNNMKCILPRVGKLKDFINSAAEKFEVPKDNKHLNLLFINWTYSEFAPDSYLEAYYLLINPENGLIRNKEIGIKMGITEDAYDKISGIIIYSDSLNGMTFLDIRYLWIDQKFRFIALNPDIDYRRIMGMNADPDPQQIVCVLGDEYVETTKDSPTLSAVSIIQENLFG